MTYDQLQEGAVEITWLCCRRTVFSTHPDTGCAACRR